ncbi:ATP-binding protein [Actinocorallia sp. A-T 12471]|uniref:ATP-binding protein n=1 Tax=Actinocorallia sp. A-T 12471 TaxID=3089813 RepID=UPI0029D3E06A|nr:ATP-binding protein [Actinocorallia sp. A-T 12471]MDX6744861.1 ATP-binding protein [Actinocorallia sp. A-T 12471]
MEESARPSPLWPVLGAALAAAPVAALVLTTPSLPLAAAFAAAVCAAFVLGCGEALRRCRARSRRLDRELREARAAAERQYTEFGELLNALAWDVSVSARRPDVADSAPWAEQTRAVYDAAFSRTETARAEAARAMEGLVVSVAQRTQTGVLRVRESVDRLAPALADRPDQLEECRLIAGSAAQLTRLAQSLVVLSGGRAGRTWARPLPLCDVLAAAAGRVAAGGGLELVGGHDVAARPRVVEPLVHAFAELLANAAQSSPGAAGVRAVVERGEGCHVVRIEDSGVGMDDAALARFTETASGAGPVSLTALGPLPRLGLPVVGAYARRFGLGVRLERGPDGGTCAVVVLPDGLVTRPTDPHESAPRALRAATGGPERPKVVGKASNGLPQRRRRAADAPTAPGSDSVRARLAAVLSEEPADRRA